MRKPTSQLEVGLGVICLGQSELAVTSYGDDHHHCSAVTVFALLIECGVLLVHTSEVNPAGPLTVRN